MIPCTGFGPVVLVRNSQNHVEYRRKASPLEVQSLDNEVKRLLAYVDVLTKRHENVLEEKDAEHKKDLSNLQLEHDRAVLERRDEYERASSAQQSEISALRSRLEKLEDSERKIATLSTLVEDLRRKGEDQEVAWSKLLSSKETQWSERQQTQEREVSSLHERVELLVLSLEELQTTLRETASEKLTMEEYIESEPQRWKESTREMQHQLNDQRSALEDLRKRNKSLESLLDDLQKEGAVHDAASDERVSLLKHELDLERKKRSETVAMYCVQVENLHAQLEASMSKNRQLLGELQREKVVHLQ